MPSPRREPSSRLPVSGQLRRALAESGQTVAALSDQAGVNHSVVSRFLADKRGLTLEVADRLCAALGLRLVEVAGGRRPVAPKRARKRREAPAANTTGRTPRDVPAGDDPLEADASEQSSAGPWGDERSPGGFG